MQDRDALVQQESPEQPTSSTVTTGDFVTDLLQSSYKLIRPGTGEMRHGTEGWKCLETSLRVRSATCWTWMHIYRHYLFASVHHPAVHAAQQPLADHMHHGGKGYKCMPMWAKVGTGQPG